MKPVTCDAYQLFHEGALALADVEANGFRVDVDYLDKALDKIDKKINRYTERLQSTGIWKQWQKKYGRAAKLGSRKQLGEMLFRELGYKGSLTIGNDEEREGGQYATDENALSKVDHPFVEMYIKRAKLDKAKGTYLLGIRREVADGFLHCFFNLHTVRSFRSSSDKPNLQNQPNRNKFIAEIVRRCFVPRKDCQLLEIDYGALEVRGIASYSQDPVLIKEVLAGDPHTQWAKACFVVNDNEMTKELRFYCKNQFVFPEFYGSWYLDCARYMWEIIGKFDLKTGDGVPLYEHLHNKGIGSLGDCDSTQKPHKGTFECHIKEVEDLFRYERYKVHTQWREDEWEKYKKKGYIDTLTGFRLSEVYRRNQIINLPIQGSCFHCLLWSLTKLNNWLKRKKFKSRIVCQIHDSLIIDVWPPELQDVIHKMNYFATVAIMKKWGWIKVPLLVEAELCGVDESWFTKKGIEI